MKNRSDVIESYDIIIDQDENNEINEDILKDIYETYSKRVFNFMCYRVNNSHIAEDLTSEVFERIIQKYHTFDSNKGNFDVWLFTIARNILNDYFRKNAKRKIFFFSDIKSCISTELNPEALVLLDEENVKLINALNTLKIKERNIVSLKYGAKLKNTEISKITGLTESNIGVILYRSLKKLRLKMEGDHDNEQF